MTPFEVASTLVFWFILFCFGYFFLYGVVEKYRLDKRKMKVEKEKMGKTNS